jgi:hypothetical protein
MILSATMRPGQMREGPIMSIASYGDGFDDYEGRPLDEWAPPSSRTPGWPTGEGWDEPDPDLDELIEAANDLAEALEAAAVTAVDAVRLDALANTRGSFVDKDETRYVGDVPYEAIVLSIDNTDHVRVVARVDVGTDSASAAWVVLESDQLGTVAAEPTAAATTVIGSPTTARNNAGTPTSEPAGTRVPSEPQAVGPWFDRGGAAAYLATDRATFDRWIDDGTLIPRLLPDGTERFPAADLDALLIQAGEASSPQGPAPTSRPDHDLPGADGPAFTVTRLGERSEVVRALSGEEADTDITLYRYADDQGNVVDFGLFRAANGEAWLHSFNVVSSLDTLGRLRHGGRLGIRAHGDTGAAELQHLRVTDRSWSRLKMATMDELSDSAGLDVEAMLNEQGAIAIGTRAELEGCASNRRNILSVHFPVRSDDVPVHAYVVTRILPLVRA